MHNHCLAMKCLRVGAENTLARRQPPAAMASETSTPVASRTHTQGCTSTDQMCAAHEFLLQ
jgi:hypothetical protein